MAAISNVLRFVRTLDRNLYNKLGSRIYQSRLRLDSQHQRTLTYAILSGIRFKSSGSDNSIKSTDEAKSSSSSSDSTSSDSSSESELSSDDEETKKPEKPLSLKQKAALNKLNSLISSMEVARSTRDNDKKVITSKLLLNLAKPLKKQRIRPEKTSNPAEEIVKSTSAEKEETESSEPKIDPELTTAVKNVAITLGGDTQKTESELLQKLRQNAIDTENGKNGSFISREMLINMKVERSKPMSDSSKIPQSGLLPGTSLEEEGATIKSFSQVPARDRRSAFQPEMFEKKTTTARHAINIFGSGKLNIFSDTSGESKKSDATVFPELKSWKKFEDFSLKLSVTHPPANGFEELILWTKQNKIWKFPINNEQGLEEEAKVSFQDHVFLDHILEEGFPKKGPIRHFMELVTNGLSKNPHITVQQKRDHIAWFQKYFEQRKDALKEIGAYD